jgi:hypothetical protein
MVHPVVAESGGNRTRSARAIRQATSAENLRGLGDELDALSPHAPWYLELLRRVRVCYCGVRQVLVAACRENCEEPS